ncbi:MAG: hypothetical protein RL653_4077 [Pseudomonadota bacterium]|jgi:hypothetical protein
MGLLPEDASFEELVTDCFAAHRGAGVMLSPLDAALVVQWARLGVPFEAVERGIRKAAERALWDARPGEPALRSLRSARKDVEAEIKKHQRLHAGAPAPSTGAPALPSAEDAPTEGPGSERKRLAAKLKKTGGDHPLLAPVLERLAAEALGGRLDRDGERRVDGALLRALPFPERLSVLKDATALEGGQRPLSHHGRRMARRFHVGAVLRRRLNLPRFW